MRQRCCRLNRDLQSARDQLRQSESERSVLEIKLKHARNQVEVEMRKRHLAETELEKQERRLQLIYDYLMTDTQISPPLNEDQQSALAVVDGLSLSRTTSLPGKRLSAVEELCTTIMSDISFDHSDDEMTSLQSGEAMMSPLDVADKAAPLQLHHFTSKMVIRSESCAACKSRLRFGKVVLKCRHCQLLVHQECKELCHAPCLSGAGPRAREGILADFAPSTYPMVPPLIVQCVNEVESRRLQETGLYRVPGAEYLVREWKHKLLCARGALPSLNCVADVHVICGLLKDFLRHLKEPLITFYLRSAFLQAADIPDETARCTALCHGVMKLPRANKDTLAFLMLHLHRVMKSPQCQMDQNNLARVFGPTLVGHNTPFAVIEDTPWQCQVVAELLALPFEFWRRFVGEQENVVPSLQQPNLVNEHVKLRMSPGSGCLPNKLQACTGNTCPPLPTSRIKKTSKFFTLPM